MLSVLHFTRLARARPARYAKVRSATRRGEPGFTRPPSTCQLIAVQMLQGSLQKLPPPGVALRTAVLRLPVHPVAEAAVRLSVAKSVTIGTHLLLHRRRSLAGHPIVHNAARRSGLEGPKRPMRNGQLCPPRLASVAWSPVRHRERGIVRPKPSVGAGSLDARPTRSTQIALGSRIRRKGSPKVRPLP